MQLAIDGLVSCLTLVTVELSRDIIQSIWDGSKAAQLKGLVSQGVSGFVSKQLSLSVARESTHWECFHQHTTGACIY